MRYFILPKSIDLFSYDILITKNASQFVFDHFDRMDHFGQKSNFGLKTQFES